jgi:hypothetical protein
MECDICGAEEVETVHCCEKCDKCVCQECVESEAWSSVIGLCAECNPEECHICNKEAAASALETAGYRKDGIPQGHKRFERSATLTLVAFAIALWCGARYDLVASGTGKYFGGWVEPHALGARAIAVAVVAAAALAAAIAREL